MVGRCLTYPSPYSHPHLEVEHAFHALALDDHRGNFSPTLWYIPTEQGNIRRTQLKQCWFAGVHTDVGRGYKDHVSGDIADITFAWMVDQCRHLLAFREEKVSKVLDKGDFKKPVRERAKRKRARREAKAQTWGLADLHKSMNPIYKLFGSAHRTPGRYVFKVRESVRLKTNKSGSGSSSRSGFITESKILPDSPPAKPWYSRFWSTLSGVFAKDISKFDPVWTSEVIHPSVRVRMMQDPTYKPRALRGFKLRYDAAHSRWTWTKKWTDNNGAVREKNLHEDHIEGSHFSMLKVDPEMLKFRVDEDEPIPPKPKRGWRFWT